MRTRILVFVTVVLAILLAANAFVFATVAHFFDLHHWLRWEMESDGVALAFVGASVLGFRHSNLAVRTVYAISATWLGLLNFAVFAAAACWLAAGVVALAGLPVARWEIGAVFFGIAVLMTVYGLANAIWLRATRVEIRWPNLPEAWRDRCAVLVTDLHLGHLSGPWFLRRVIGRIRALRPDVVFISGDLFDGTTAQLDRLVAPWREFSPPWGVFYVTGNHDEFADRAIYLAAIERAGIRVLNNEKAEVHGLQIIGAHDSEAENPEELRRILRDAKLDRTRPAILLAHKPINLAVAEEEGVSLQLSGHTHRGQFWPWTVVVRRVFGRFGYGLNRLGRMLVYTSSGAGTWGPPLRVGTRSELVVIRFAQAEPD
ncbi:MAG: metallophosphoesterase [Verrucomicrobiota bacterium]